MIAGVERGLRPGVTDCWGMAGQEMAFKAFRTFRARRLDAQTFRAICVNQVEKAASPRNPFSAWKARMRVICARSSASSRSGTRRRIVA